MRINKLKAILHRLMFAGCSSIVISATISAPVLAENFSQFQYKQFSGNQVNQVRYANYRFRPLENRVVAQRLSHPGTSYLPHGSVYQPYIPRRHSFPAYSYRLAQPVNVNHYLAQTKPVRSYRAPAFTRQYAWEAAQPKGFRRGGSVNHYSNQINDSVAQGDVSVYRAIPVTTDGFQFRTSTRNANYVTFSDRIKAVKPARYASPVQTEHRLDSFRPAVKTVKIKPPKPSYLAGQSLMNSGNYRFRPDERFQLARQETAVISNPSVVPVSYKLADAEMSKAGDNSWNQWSFRPAASAFQDSF